MFSKLLDLVPFGEKDKPLIDISVIQGQMYNGLFEVMEDSFAKQQSDVENSNFSLDNVDDIIAKYAKRNRLLAMASSIVPGPFGVLGAVPELLLNFANQMNMIYDLGCAYDKESFINKDILLDIPMAAFGGNTDLAAIQNYGTDLLDSPTDLLMGKATALGKDIIEKTLKKSVIQFIPVAGPVLMGIWAKKTTNKISKSATRFLDSKADYVEHFKPEETEEITRALQIEKIKGMANLIEANDDINENQIEMIKTIIDNSLIPMDQREYYFTESLRNGSNFQLDYQLLKDYEEDEDLVMDLVIMANRTGQIDEHERDYIYKIGQQLGLEAAFVEDLLN